MCRSNVVRWGSVYIHTDILLSLLPPINNLAMYGTVYFYWISVKLVNVIWSASVRGHCINSIISKMFLFCTFPWQISLIFGWKKNCLSVYSQNNNIRKFNDRDICYEAKLRILF